MMTARTPLNVDALTAWCKRHGLNAEEIPAEAVEPSAGRDGLTYTFRRIRGHGDDTTHDTVAVTVPVDDPLPPLYVLP